MFGDLKLGERISLLRQIKKMTQKELASELHVSDKTISKWENSENEPCIADIQKLSDIFNASLDLMLTGIPSKKNDNKLLESIDEYLEYKNSELKINNFYKNNCPYKDLSCDDLFIILNNKPYALLENVLAIDDYDFFNKVNSTFVFIHVDDIPETEEDEDEDDEESDLVGEANVKRQIKVKELPHPYQLQLNDLFICDNLKFYDDVLDALNKKYQKDMDYYNQRNQYGLQQPTSIESQLSNHLEELVINDYNNDAIYHKIIYLIDRGATYSKINPYEYCEGYQVYEDYTKTDLMYKISLDHINYKNEIKELKDQINKLVKSQNVNQNK